MAQSVVPPALSVQRTAPQLVAFAGSPANFQNLVNGLAQGTAVQISTVLPDGSTQLVTFTPTGAMTPTQIAQVLESARQRLISLGIATPTAEQIALTLMGGVVPTALGGSQVPGVLSPQSTPSPAAQAQANAAFGSSAAAGATSLGSTSTSTTPAPTSTPATTPPVNVQVIPATTAATATTLPRVNTSDSAIPAGATSRSPTPPAPTLPGPSATANPTPPGETPSSLTAAPTATTPPATAPAATPPAAKTPAPSTPSTASTAQPGPANTPLRAR
jgi:hypothetical protein